MAWAPPNKIEVSAGILVDPESMLLSFVADGRRVLGLPYESRSFDEQGQPVIRYGSADEQTLAEVRERLEQAGYDVEYSARYYRIEKR